MKNKYNVTDIIEAINLLLEPNINTKKFTDKLEKPKIEPLKLVKEIKPSENNTCAMFFVTFVEGICTI